MAKSFLSTANPFLSSTLSSPSPSHSSSFSSSSSSSSKRQLIFCKAFSDNKGSISSLVCSKRGFSLGFISSFVFSVGGRERSFSANAAILEADDDEELLEKVKRDRKKRIERQGVISSSDKERGYLQDVVYQLSKVGQAIESNDLSEAGSVLGGSTDAEWVKKANAAFTKLSSSPEEKTQVDTFNSSLASLISSVSEKDVESSKIAFVSSAVAFEKWMSLTGLIGQLKGL